MLGRFEKIAVLVALMTGCGEAPASVVYARVAGQTTEPTAAEAPIDLESDPFNIRRTSLRIAELGRPSPADVRNLGEQARVALEAGDCRAAVPLLEQHAKQANWLSNLIVAGLEPFYGASYDDRRSVTGSALRELADFETLANDYKEQRNRSMVLHGECLVRLGDQDGAVAILVNALDLISVDDREWWTRARNELYRMIEVVDSADRPITP